jgi:hypothetical protein
MRILAIVQGHYGSRHVANIRGHGPSDWSIDTWTAPRALPLVIDEPEEFVSAPLAEADLLLAFQEDARAAQLIPEVARRCSARAVIAPVDREEWLPRGLVTQLSRWFEERQIPAVFPKPFCSLTEEAYGLRDNTRAYHSEPISEFARSFGRPAFEITCDEGAGTITFVKVVRDTCCGCARSVAAKLAGVSVGYAEHVAGLAHHHHPCMASMKIDPEYNDALMHVSGNILKDEVHAALAPGRRIAYVIPNAEGPR